jgi:hypothetical protein
VSFGSAGAAKRNTALREMTKSRRARSTGAVLALALVLLSGCATTQVTRQHHDLRQEIAQADAAYRSLNASHVAAYNNAVASIARQIDGETPGELRTELDSIGVTLDQPHINLPLARYHLAPESGTPNDSRQVGAPMLLDYDTRNAPLYPRDGLVTPATAVYRVRAGEAHLSLLTGKTRIELNGSAYPLKIDNVAPVTFMARRGRGVARGGLSFMLHPAAIGERAGIVLTEPYDPNKAIVLMVHGLQSTPFTFVDLTKTIRRDRELSSRFQVWTFLYATGTPMLFNALELRLQLNQAIRAVDPQDHDFATKHIVVIGHSMGGIMAHTLVSSSGETLWNALFTVPRSGLRGDKESISGFDQRLHFQRNRRVVRAIFIATPHRGSKLATSWIGHVAESLIRLPTNLRAAIVEVANENVDVATPEAKAYRKELNLSSVRMLSPDDPVLNTLAQLHIAVPYHSIIGQHRPGPLETSSDGVVAYTSSHLDGAASELIVQSGHGVPNSPAAQAEVARILRLELNRRR